MEAGGEKGSSTFGEMLTQPWSRCIIPEVALVCSWLGKEPFFLKSWIQQRVQPNSLD